jgi:hydrogenase maturation protease
LRTLVIGYGNLDRSDDGVALWVVNALRRYLGQEALAEERTGLEGLGKSIDSVFLTQLVSELTDVMSAYDSIIFVDAHVYENSPDLRCTQVLPSLQQSAFTHHVTPELLIALFQHLHRRELNAFVVSVRGHNFDFGPGLSPATAALVEPAVRQIVGLLPSVGADWTP